MTVNIKQMFNQLGTNINSLTARIKSVLRGKSPQGRTVHVEPGKAHFNHVNINVQSHFSSNMPSASLYSRKVTFVPPQMYYQMNPAEARMNRLLQSDVSINDLKSHPEDLALAKTSITSKLTARGFSSREATTITNTLLNDQTLDKLTHVENIAKSLSCSAMPYDSLMNKDAQGQQRYRTLLHNDVTLEQLKAHPKDLGLVSNGLQAVLLGKGFPAVDAKAMVENMLVTEGVTTLKQLDELIRGTTEQTEDASSYTPPGMSKEQALKELGLPSDASEGDIKKTYRKKMLQLHPDKTQHLSTDELKKRLQLPDDDVRSESELRTEAQKQYEVIQKAYKVLIP